MFESVNASSQFYSSIVVRYRAVRLKDGGSVIIFLVYIVNGNTTFFGLCGDYGFVYVIAIHTLSAKGG